jgi:carbon storage regulator
MLVLTRKAGEGIVLNSEIVLTVIEVRGRRVRLGIQAPEDVVVLRRELADFKTGRPEPDPVDENAGLSPYECFGNA